MRTNLRRAVMDCTIIFLDNVSAEKKENVLKRIAQYFENNEIKSQIISPIFNEISLVNLEESKIDSVISTIDSYFMRNNLLTKIRISDGNRVKI